MPVIPEASQPEEIAKRLRLTREALGYTQKRMAELAGVGLTAWNNWERGKGQRISIDSALALWFSTGLTLEWIYQGDIESLPVRLAKKIQAEMEKKAT